MIEDRIIGGLSRGDQSTLRDRRSGRILSGTRRRGRAAATSTTKRPDDLGITRLESLKPPEKLRDHASKSIDREIVSVIRMETRIMDEGMI